MGKAYAAVDIGNSSGRVMLGRVGEGRIEISEVRRIPNAPIRLRDGWHWDVRSLFDEALAGLRQAADQAELDGIAIDTWGVDYGLLAADGTLLGDPYSYRDERTLPMIALGEARMAADLLYGLTGCQAGPINTLYQLLADQRSGRMDRAGHFLLNPDLFAYWLTGEIGADEDHRIDKHSSSTQPPVIGAGVRSTRWSCRADYSLLFAAPGQSSARSGPFLDCRRAHRSLRRRGMTPRRRSWLRPVAMISS